MRAVYFCNWLPKTIMRNMSKAILFCRKTCWIFYVAKEAEMMYKTVHKQISCFHADSESS